MSGRFRDIYQKFKSGAQKRKIKTIKKHQDERQKNSLFKFLKKDENDSIAGSSQIESQINLDFQSSDSDNVSSEKVQVQSTRSYSDSDEYKNVPLVSGDLQPKKDIESRKVQEEENNNEDPGNWPQSISDKLRVYLIKYPPPKMFNYIFPSNDEGRKFSVVHYNRIMANGENVLRNWLSYSKSLNRVFCLYCRLFPSKSTSSLASVGFPNWKQISERLKEHELSIPHNMAQEKWVQLRMRLNLHKTVDYNKQDN